MHNNVTCVFNRQCVAGDSDGAEDNETFHNGAKMGSWVSGNAVSS